MNELLEEKSGSEYLFTQLTRNSSKELSLVLFINKEESGSNQIIEKFASLNIPEAYTRRVLHVHDHSKIVAYFGILEVPAVAIISQGSLLGVVGDCSEKACEWVVKCAEGTLRALKRF